MTKEEIEKVINQGKELLLENNWINEQDFSKFCNNKKIRECIEKCTSPNKNDIFNQNFSLRVDKATASIKDCHSLIIHPK